MKNKILYLIAFTAMVVGAAGCKKSFLEDLKSYDKYDESAFTNEVLTGYYIDRLYNYFFVNYKSPTQAETTLGSYDDSKTKNTEEIGGTVSNYINPNRNLMLATDADNYYGGALTASISNTPYTRIRLANFLLEKIDEVGTALSPAFRDRAKGQMYYFRALQYYYLVRAYGGVPLVLTVQNASSTDASIRIPRATASQCFTQIVKDFDSAAALLPAVWPTQTTDYGRFTSAAALAMKSRVLLTAASPLFNSDWDNTSSPKWQAALDAGLQAETALTAAGYGLYGSTAKDWADMFTAKDNASITNTTTPYNKEAIFTILLSTNTTSSAGYNSAWENSIRPKDQNGSGGISVPKGMLDLFPLANGARPTTANGYVDTFFFENRDPRFYRTFAFSGSKWGIKTNANRTSFFYRWRPSATGTITYSGNNQTTSPAVVKKMANPAADSSAFTYSGTDIIEYRYAELLLNIAECYAAKGDIANCLVYLGKIRARVGISSANNYGIGTLATKYAAIEACLYERRVELAYEGKRYWDIQRWLLYDGSSATNTSANTCSKLGIAPINGSNRTGYYWQSINYTSSDPLTAADKSIIIDPDAANFTTQIAALKTLYKTKLVMTPLDQALDRDGTTPVNILYRPNYYLSGLSATVLSLNPWLKQNIGWQDYSGGAGTFNSTE
ncbi:MAG: RagB/SusD family nutrient uptake outer membrane protein [Bacteroidetes bacterium]|nr:RagB/SusD family nutrient uptake outer membrane protein [Bacteroidota bacterium]